MPGHGSFPARFARLSGHRALPALLLLLLALAPACAGNADRPAAPVTDATARLIEEAQAAESRREYLEAMTLYQRAKEEAPDPGRRAFAARTFGRALIFYGEYLRARFELEEAARLQPDDAGTWHDLGLLLHRQGEYDRAEQAFDQAIRLAPRDPRPRMALGAYLVFRTRYTEAIRVYRELLALDPPESMRAQIESAIEMLERERAREQP